MHRLRRWLLAVFMVAPFPGHAQDLGLKLRLQPSLMPPPVEDTAAEDAPLFIDADRMSGTQDESVQASGDVRLRSRGRTLSADKFFYSIKDEQFTAEGNVRLDRSGDVLEADKVFFDVAKEQGYADSPEYYFRAMQARGKASKIYLDSKTRYRAEEATYSTCEVPEDGWYLKVNKLDLNRDKNKGTARGAKLIFKDWPILYTPYIDFPLSNARKSGLLAPTYGTTRQSGFEFTVPLYLNLAPNYDATIAPRVLARRGVMVNSEFRYLNQRFNGLLNAEYLANDQVTGDTRYGLAFRHNHQLTQQLSGYLNLQKVSDDRYFIDLSNRLAVTTQRNLPREGGLTWQGGWWSVFGRAQSFQTLQDPAAPLVPPYARLPQLLFNGLRANEKGFDINMQAEYAAFDHPTLITGNRSTFYPSVSYPLQRSFVNVVPKLGLNYTHYQLDQRFGVPNQDRTLPVFSLDGTMTFDRTTQIRGKTYLQTLEPRLFYVYIPYRDQSMLPVFDSGLADFNLAQIFTENQFVGGDRINDANQLTAAISSRLIDPDDGSERIKATIAQRTYFADQRVTLPNTAIRTQNRSDVLAAITGRITKSWYTDLAAQFDTQDSRIDRSSYVLRYNPEPGRVLNLGYRFNRDSFEQADVSGQWPLTDRWSFVGRYTYSLQDRRTTTIIGGVEYNEGCWAARFVMQQFVTFTQTETRALFFQLEFTGLSRLGSNPLEILRQNVFGYQPMNALPQTTFNEDSYPVR
ncbi:MAG: LPS-assembly protein LptD [Burkholderiales bacterium]|nr:LPS-assembly protein LptD [Burkholderiales bacterium]